MQGIAKGVYQTPEQFIAGVFLDQTPQTKMLWLNKKDKAEIAKILSHSYNRLRIRYWQYQTETVWILDEIGKEKPITMGIHIKGNFQNSPKQNSPKQASPKHSIVELKVLTFRESRGDEIRHSFFTEQFVDASLKSDNSLSNHVDGITGATLSVRATTKLARLALWLTNKASEK